MGKKEPTYRMEAEPGKFGVEGKDVGKSPFPIQGDQIVVGVVAMHNMMISMVRALGQSNKTLMQLMAAVGDDSKVHDLPVDKGYLETIINENLDILGGIKFNE